MKKNLRTLVSLMMLLSTISFSSCAESSEPVVVKQQSTLAVANTTAETVSEETQLTTEPSAESTVETSMAETTTSELEELASSITTSAILEEDTETLVEVTTPETTVSTVATTMEVTTSSEVSTSETAIATSVIPSEKRPVLISDYEIPEVVEDNGKTMLQVQNIQQLPELPAGCEITSTTIALNYLGFDVDKMELMSYMPIMKAPDENGYWASPWDVFVGSPEYSYYGAYSPVIKSTIEAFFEQNDIENYEVIDLSDNQVIELIDYIDEGYPVIVWATIGMKRSHPGNSWTLSDGTPYTWIAGEHCLVLIGYDLINNTLIFSDPYDKRGTVEYDFEVFESRYIELFMQALVVKPVQQ